MSHVQSFLLPIKQLNNRPRKVWVYLPDNYTEDGKPLPVIYMHDGQNVFWDDHADYGASWQAGIALDDIFLHTNMGAVIVAVENDGQRRLSEYSPWKLHWRTRIALRRGELEKCNLGGEGDAYMQYFVNDLKNYVDSNYNVDRSQRATAIIGSSMGGLISCYVGLKNQQIYGTMGLFSTHSQFNMPKFNAFLRHTPQTEQQHALVYCGSREYGTPRREKRMEQHSVNLFRQLKGRGIHAELLINSNFIHYEHAWATYFPKFAHDFLQRYYNGQ